jgi:hypothetical protein
MSTGVEGQTVAGALSLREISIAKSTGEAAHSASMKMLRYHLLLVIVLAVCSTYAQEAKTKSASPSPNNSGLQPLPSQQSSSISDNRPAPEIQQAAQALVGTWSITQKFEPDEWTPNGGTAEGEEVWRSGPGGFTLMEEAHWKEANGKTVYGLALAWSNVSKGLQGIWCESDNPNGCDLTGAASGSCKWQNNELVIDTEFERHGQKFAWHEVFSDITATSFTQTADIGEKGGKLKRWLTIHATRAKTATPALKSK